MKTVVIIPALNEAEAIGKVIADIPRECVDRIIVVDNGSTDSTADEALSHGVQVVSEICRGYGKACLAGIKNIPQDTDIVVFCDADYSDHPEELGKLIDPIIRDDYDFVLGSRLLEPRNKASISSINWFGNRLVSLVLFLLFRLRCTDLGPFRAIRRDALDVLAMDDENYGWTVEMQIKAHVCGLRVKEVPVLYRKRIGQAKITGTFLGSIKAFFKIAIVIAQYFLKELWKKKK